MLLETVLKTDLQTVQKKIKHLQMLLLIKTSPKSREKLEKDLIRLFKEQTKLEVQIELLTQTRLN